MDLIEQLGGYEKALDLFRGCPWDSGTVDVPNPRSKGMLRLELSELSSELLKYRRQHNIFEPEDKIVVKNDCLIDFADLTLNLKVLTVLMVTDEGFIRSIESAGLFKSSLVRHATDEEIKANRRLEG